MPDSPELTAFVQRFRRLTVHADPTTGNPAADRIRAFAASLDGLDEVTEETLTNWVEQNPDGVYTLALAVGLSQEKLKGLLKAEFGSESWRALGKTQPKALVEWMNAEFDVATSIAGQRRRLYAFGDVLAARGTSRQTASSAGAAGKLIEDVVEAVVVGLGLQYKMRGRFAGVNGRTAPADLMIPRPDDCQIAVACKGFDSTGSKLTAAVNEITEMVDVHRPHQYLMAVVDGIGWHRRMGDLRRMYEHFAQRRIEGIYTLSDMGAFRDDLERAARLRGLLPG